MIQSWDMAFKDLATSDYVVGQVWGACKADRYLLDQVRNRWDMPATKAAVQELSRRWPKAGTKLVEGKANGPAVIQELRHDVPGLIAVNPEGGKMARAQAVSPQVESGNVYLPHPALGRWVEDLIEEAAAFPHGRNDDQVDAMTQALNRLRGTGASYVVPESRITVNPFSIPEEWPRAFAMVVARDKVAAVWGARDRGGTIYLHAEHAFPHAEPSENARAIRAHGASIPGLIHIANGSTDRHRVTQLYQQVGLNVQSCASVEDAALFQFWHLLTTNQLKVFASLSMFLEEYRIGEEQSPLLVCAHSLVSRLDLMIWEEPASEDDDCYGRWSTSSPYSGPSGWMR
jgi:predicted phage terminase large subunit-like protein